jgi:hypothetical protein
VTSFQTDAEKSMGTTMLKWCAYCRQFMRQSTPRDDFSITHGLCNACAITSWKSPMPPTALPPDVRPTIIVGGYPVKAGLIKAIPAAELLSDISALPLS